MDFFHDVVCSWCYVMSRLRQAAAELGIQVRQRSFVLQDNREQMVQVFGSMARQERDPGPLGNLPRHEDQPRIDVEGMRAENFEYPSGLAGALACQAAHLVAGDAGHWDMFDAIQDAHLSRTATSAISTCCWTSRWPWAMTARLRRTHAGRQARQRVQADRDAAMRLGIRSIPTLIVGADLARLQTTPLAALRQRLQALASAQA